MDFSKILKDLRNKKNVTQDEMANILDIDRTTYNHYENNYNTLPIKYLNIIANFFDVSFDYLFELSSDRQYKKTHKDIKLHVASARLKEVRKELHLTQGKLASIVNTTQSVIANYERGRNIIATPFLYEICKKCKVSSDYLLGKIDEPKYLK